jgi:hypothetical protein
MYNIESYNGRRIESSVAPGLIKIQFDSRANMDRWMGLMREIYSPNQFSPCINRDAYIVVF